MPVFKLFVEVLMVASIETPPFAALEKAVVAGLMPLIS
jgi:hypothetical protein